MPGVPVHAITNGVHAVTWTSTAFRQLYDHHIPEWPRDNLYLRYAIGISIDEIMASHLDSKRTLFAEIQARTGVGLREATFTIGFARRATQYKRLGLLFSDPERLRSIARDIGPLQICYAGKAHPADQSGKDAIRHIFMRPFLPRRYYHPLSGDSISISRSSLPAGPTSG